MKYKEALKKIDEVIGKRYWKKRIFRYDSYMIIELKNIRRFYTLWMMG